MDSFLKDSFRGFVSCKQKSQITRFVSFRTDSYTNPASLKIYIATELCMKRTHYFALEDVDKINSLSQVQLFFFVNFLNDYYFSTDYPN